MKPKTRENLRVLSALDALGTIAASVMAEGWALPSPRRCPSALLALLLVLAGLLLADRALADARRIALVIGNGAYTGEERLDTPRQDAEDMRAALTKLGFTVVPAPYLDLDQRGLEQAVQKLAQASREADVALFYYAGHGVGRGGDNWLIPVHTEIADPADLRYRAVSLRWIAEKLKMSGARARVLIVDACRNNRWYEADRGPGERGLERIKPPAGTLIAYAAAPGETAQDKHPSRPNGLYTGELVQALTQEPQVEIRELIRRVGERVNRIDPGQNPSTEEIGFYASLYLAEPRPEVHAEPPPDPRAEEDAFWRETRQQNTAQAYQAYLTRYPQGHYADWARAEIARLERPEQPTGQVLPPPGAGSQEDIRAHLQALQGQINEAAKTAPQAFELTSNFFRDCPDCPEMVVIPAGEFRMGSPEGEADREKDEGPQHRVTIGSPFAIGKYEVTFAEWDACVVARGCRHKPSDNDWGRGRQPVINVSWDDAQEYVAWLSKKTGKRYRLPSEAEWEYAARAGTTTRYPWGDDPERNKANFVGSGNQWSDKQTAPVGSFAPTGFGLHDMIGNVLEWVQECYHESYSGAPADGSAWEGGKCKVRVQRGGSWYLFPRDARSANRSWSTRSVRAFDSGFRVARTLP